MGRWLERYQDGQCSQVWTEMTSLGADIRSDDESLADAKAVGRETMRRVRANVEQLVELLPGIGFEFEREPFIPPSENASQELDELERTIGRMPLALRLWFEEIGEVDLVGRHPAWDFDYPDPLVVQAPVGYVLSEFEEFEHDRGTEWDRGSAFEVPIAPDYLHKADVSGGMPYSMAVPNAGADGLLLWEPHQTTFVNYLRIAFAMGGMPGWQRHPALLEDWASPPSAPPSELVAIARRLLAL